jgi:3,4-dihydroxy 2-butanone 4-phosphate synthase/GTP cyclohydrolase II
MASQLIKDGVASIDEIFAEARAGRMFLLVDEEDRENEGDLVIPADAVTPEAINFMATHGRGLICLCLTEQRVEALGLPLMSARNASRHGTAFTVSIEAREGVTTGISAHDRARTIRVATDPACDKTDIITPGHVFPLRARDGGVLVRAGHTEAAVDICRLAGRLPAAAICEVVRDDGHMARLPDLMNFAQRHGLKIGAISDLIAYRRRHDNLVRQIEERQVVSRWGGTWSLRVFRDSTRGADHIALVKGEIRQPGRVPVRIHSLDPLSDVLGLDPSRTGKLPAAMEYIAAGGRGVVLIMRETDLRIVPEINPGDRLRHYGLGAQILAALGVTQIELLTNSSPPKVVGLDAYGLEIVTTRTLREEEAK